MELIIHTFELQLKHPFTISRRSFDRVATMVVELKDDQGFSGFGEATHNPYYPNTDVPAMVKKLYALKTLIEQSELNSAAAFWKKLHPHLVDFPFAQCALDQAAHDLCARRVGLPLYRHLGLSLQNAPLSSFTLSINPLSVMIQRMKEMPWPIYKIKLGKATDLKIIQGLRKHTDAPFRVDANCGWNLEQALYLSRHFKDLGVELIEQPLPVDQWKAMEKLYAECPLPLFADESCKTEADIEKCVGRFHGINIKLMKSAGITPALKMIEKAKKLGLKVMVGCMTESTVGISALAHILPLVDFVDADGPLFLSKDIASGVTIRAGGMEYPQENGIGVRLTTKSL